MSSLGSNIKFLRERHNITPLAMSKKLKISLQDYNAWESGLSLPTINNVMDICAVYGLKNPTDLFSENFVQIYNSMEIKTVKEVAKRKAEAQKHAEQSDEKLNFVIKDGSYYGNTTLFSITICLAIGVILSLFLPCYTFGGKSVIGYLAVTGNVLGGVFIYLITAISLFVIFGGIKSNYKILEGNEFMTRNLAITLKVVYVLSGLLVGALSLFVYFTAVSYEYGLTVFTAFSLVYMVFAVLSALSIRAAKKDMVTYTYVIKFSKYKLRTDRPRKSLKALSIIGLVLTILAIGLAVAQLVMDKVLLVDSLGINKGVVKTVTDAFYAMLPIVTNGVFNKVCLGLAVALILVTHISNIAVSSRVQKTDYNGYLKDEQTKSVRKHLSFNFALNILAYIITYSVIILSLTSTIDGTKLIYQYYLIPILTGVSLLIALKFLAYPRVYGAFRGAETYEVTGFSEVKLDEEKKQKKLEKKNKEPKEPKEKAPKEKPEKKKEAEATPEVNSNEGGKE